MPRKVLLIVNRRARHGANKIAKAFDLLTRFNIEFVEEEATAGGNPLRGIQSRLGTFDAVVVAGGDGTINSALGALVHGDTPLTVTTTETITATDGVTLKSEWTLPFPMRGTTTFRLAHK